MWEQSDDKMVKIWRTSDWGLEADITSPFINAPGTTLFRRLRYGHHENANMDLFIRVYLAGLQMVFLWQRLML
jgi:hypothetical protein